MTGLIVREFAGGRLIQFFAGLAVSIAPIFLILDDFYSMNALEPPF